MPYATAHPEGLDTVLLDVIEKTQPWPRRPFIHSNMTLEEWMRRPVYIVQSRTTNVARAMGVACFRFRCLPGYRDEQAKVARKLVADWFRKERQRIAL